MRGINRYNITEWFRNCPKCGERVYHKNKHSLDSGLYCNRSCWECRCKETSITNTGSGNPMYGKHHTKESIDKLIKANSGKKLSSETINKMRIKLTGLKRSNETKERIKTSKIGKNNPFYGKKHTIQTIKKISSRLSALNEGENNPFFGKTHTPEIRQKLRELTLENIKKSGGFVGYNKNGCKFFDILNQKLNWNGERALKNGEKTIIGYSVDYYEPTLNLIIEWDEERHYKNGILKEKDIQRQTNILKNFPEIHFLRIREKTKEITQADSLPENYMNNVKEILYEYKIN